MFGLTGMRPMNLTAGDLEVNDTITDLLVGINWRKLRKDLIRRLTDKALPGIFNHYCLRRLMTG
jgi:hypothetical protein